MIDHYVWLLKQTLQKVFLLFIKRQFDSLTRFYWTNKPLNETEPYFIKQARVTPQGGQGNIISEKQTDYCVPVYFIVSTL